MSTLNHIQKETRTRVEKRIYEGLILTELNDASNSRNGLSVANAKDVTNWQAKFDISRASADPTQKFVRMLEMEAFSRQPSDPVTNDIDSRSYTVSKSPDNITLEYPLYSNEMWKFWKDIEGQYLGAYLITSETVEGWTDAASTPNFFPYKMLVSLVQKHSGPSYPDSTVNKLMINLQIVNHSEMDVEYTIFTKDQSTPFSLTDQYNVYDLIQAEMEVTSPATTGFVLGLHATASPVPSDKEFVTNLIDNIAQLTIEDQSDGSTISDLLSENVTKDEMAETYTINQASLLTAGDYYVYITPDSSFNYDTIKVAFTVA